MSLDKAPSLTESWSIFTSHVKPRRLFQEDAGVKGPLWFGSEPTSPFHNLANILRLFFAIIFSPAYVFLPTGSYSSKSDFWKKILWSIEWARTPDAVLLEPPGSLVVESGKSKFDTGGQYAVTGNKPMWLLRVKFKGGNVEKAEQVKYGGEREDGDGPESEISMSDDDLRKEIEGSGYTAISYAINSAEALIPDSPYRLHLEPDILADGKRKYTHKHRLTIARALLDEFARARNKMMGKEDGHEFIWLDEFCLCDDNLSDEEKRSQRNTELGQLADIFRGARRVAIFCHIERCSHTGFNCPWANRLFTMGEILYTSEVLCMTRKFDSQSRLSSFITIKSGSEFRSDMQVCAAKKKQWHLYNIMQHATNSGTVPWHSAIHSLIVEAIRRDNADEFYDHNFLGKALNGLLPRRAQLADLKGSNGWADLAWLLELNQGYYNAAMLAAVCKLADDNVENYRWWGKPIPPKEGSERLEPLVHAIPVSFRTALDRPVEPTLSIISPRSATISHWLHRDSDGLYRNPEMKSLKQWAIGTCTVLVIICTFITVTASLPAGLVLMYVVFITFTIFQLLVGTMFVEKQTWVIVDDRTTADRDHYTWLQSQDPTFEKDVEWGSRQLIPEWDTPYAGPSVPGAPPLAFAATLIDLRTGVLTKAVVTKRPNSMIALAVHGSGITCMLLDRSEKVEAKPTTAVKVGMANLPPFMLAQSKKASTVYIGSHEGRFTGGHVDKPNAPPAPVKLGC